MDDALALGDAVAARRLLIAARGVLVEAEAGGVLAKNDAARRQLDELSGAVADMEADAMWALAYRITIPLATPSNNVIKGMQHFAYRDLRRVWRDHVWVGLKGKLPKKPLPLSRVVVHRHSNGHLDWDNAFGGLKILFDCLVVPTPRNPDGLGIITDDNPLAMPEPPYVRQLKARRGEGFTECLIYAPRISSTGQP